MTTLRRTSPYTLRTAEPEKAAALLPHVIGVGADHVVFRTVTDDQTALDLARAACSDFILSTGLGVHERIIEG